MYKYFVSYWWISEDDRGNGNAVFDANRKIKADEDIREVERTIAGNEGYTKVVLISFTKL